MSFYDEIIKIRETVRNEKIIEQKRLKEESLFKERLLKYDQEAINSYYQQYQEKLRLAAKNYNDMFIFFIYSGKEFDQIHDIIIEKFAHDGLHAYKDRHGPYINGFSFKNVI